MRIEIDPFRPKPRAVSQVADILKKVGAVEVDNVLIGVVVLTVIDGDIYISIRLKVVDAN